MSRVSMALIVVGVLRTAATSFATSTRILDGYLQLQENSLEFWHASCISRFARLLFGN